MSKIKSIEIEIGGEVLKMSPEEARELYGELNRMFGSCPYPHYNWSLRPTVWANGTVPFNGTITQVGDVQTTTDTVLPSSAFKLHSLPGNKFLPFRVFQIPTAN